MLPGKKELEEERKKQVELEANMLELEREMAALVADNPTPGEKSGVQEVLPGVGCSLEALGSFLQQCGLDEEAVKKLNAGAVKIQREQQEAAEAAKAKSPAPGVGGGGQAPTAPPVAPPPKSSPPAGAAAGTAGTGQGRATSGEDADMQDDDPVAPRAELESSGLLQAGGPEAQVRALGERLGSWAVAKSKRQRLQKT